MSFLAEAVPCARPREDDILRNRGLTKPQVIADYEAAKTAWAGTVALADELGVRTSEITALLKPPHRLTGELLRALYGADGNALAVDGPDGAPIGRRWLQDPEGPPPAPADRPAPLTRPEWPAEAAGGPIRRVGPIAGFRAANLVRREGFITAQVMHTRYADWCAREGYEPLLLIPFGQELQQAGVARDKKRIAGREISIWLNVGLLELPAEHEAPADAAEQEEPKAADETPPPAPVDDAVHEPVGAPVEEPVRAVEAAAGAAPTLEEAEAPAEIGTRLAAFIAERCVLGAQLRAATADFFAAYTGRPWSPRENEALLELTAEMAALGYPKIKLKRMFFSGLALRDAPAAAAPAGGRPRRPEPAPGPEGYIAWLRAEVERREAEKARRIDEMKALTEALGEVDLDLSNYRAALHSAERLAA